MVCLLAVELFFRQLRVANQMLTRGKAYELSTDRLWKLRLFLWHGQREGWDEKTMDVDHR